MKWLCLVLFHVDLWGYYDPFYFCSECAIIIPAGSYHNVINEQPCALKILSIYAPAKHPVGTIHKTKFESDLEEY